jgi:hypothetical protein
VPEDRRDLIPIVADARGILWVIGHAMDERCLPTSPKEWDESTVVIEMIPREES